MRTALEGPHGPATTITWVVATLDLAPFAVAQVADAQQTWRDRRRPAIAGRGQITAQ